MGAWPEPALRALLARAALLGSCNGWVTLMGTLCAEIGEREGSGGELKVMSRVIASGSVAQLAGPAIGGALYGRFGSSKRGWPALPPSAVGATLALVTLARNALDDGGLRRVVRDRRIHA